MGRSTSIQLEIVPFPAEINEYLSMDEHIMEKGLYMDHLGSLSSGNRILRKCLEASWDTCLWTEANCVFGPVPRYSSGATKTQGLKA